MKGWSSSEGAVGEGGAAATRAFMRLNPVTFQTNTCAIIYATNQTTVVLEVVESALGSGSS